MPLNPVLPALLPPTPVPVPFTLFTLFFSLVFCNPMHAHTPMRGHAGGSSSKPWWTFMERHRAWGAS